MTKLLDVRGLHASYGPTLVLHGLDFAVEEGGITTILGANGAGKTTTLRAVCGMVKTRGEIDRAAHQPSPSWLEVDREALRARILGIPKREELVQIQLNEQLIVELYSK